ncbi:MAG TPA: phage holin family protein [Polyangiaceae bacterium]|nr:phage holin family protein [Polyangiaceae bacterium]
MALLISWVTVAVGLWLADKLLSGFEITGDWKSYALVAALLGVLQFFLGWLIFVVLGVATLGLGFVFSFLTRLIVSAIVLLIADKLSSRLSIRGFLPAFLGAVIIALTGSAADFMLR